MLSLRNYSSIILVLLQMVKSKGLLYVQAKAGRLARVIYHFLPEDTRLRVRKTRFQFCKP